MMRTGKDAKSDRLFGWFPGKRFLRFPILATKNGAGQACPLPLDARVMFAYLAARTADGEYTSLSEIARATGLNRTSAVIPGRDLLLGLGLLFYHKHKNVAVEPEDWVRDFFRYPEKLAGAPHWSARYQYLWYVPAGRSLPVVAQAAYWLLWSHGDGTKVRVCQEGLAVQLGTTARTFRRALVRLEETGLVRLYTDRKLTAGFLRPSVETLTMFIDRREPVGEAEGAAGHLVEVPGVVYPGNTRAKPETVEPDDGGRAAPQAVTRDVVEVRHRAIDAAMRGLRLTPEEVDLVNCLDDRGFAPRDMRRCVETYRVLGRRSFVTLFNAASREHIRNTGDVSRGDCFALFRWKVRNHLGDFGAAS